MTHDPPEGVVRFTKGTDEVAYKMPHNIEQYDSLSNLEKEHTKSVYLRNEEDKRRGVETGTASRFTHDAITTTPVTGSRYIDEKSLEVLVSFKDGFLGG
ncbi:hypothetical protein Tco_0988319 [Tanacetum coccineum]|uniref:Uncharacterized protein n=1 Tax=Tanacetum coccineum TaxID=301880 RepID=A0ABQ5ERJ2_9ASTR